MITDVIKLIEEEIYEEATKQKAKAEKPASNTPSLKKLQLTQTNLDRYKNTAEGGFLSHFRTSPNVKGYLYLNAGKIAGGVAVEKSSDGYLWIQALQVASPLQKKGYGTIFLKDAIALGATHISVRKTNKEAVHMYLKAGFKVYRDTGYQYLMSTKNMGGTINVADPIQKGAPVTESSDGVEEIPFTKENVSKYRNTPEGEYLNRFIAGPGIKGSLLVKDGVLVGAVAIQKGNGGYMWVQALEVTKKFQHQGYGKRLISIATGLGATHLSVRKDNACALKIYKDAGFKVYQDNGAKYLMTTMDPNTQKTIKESVEEMKRKDPVFASKFTESVEMTGTDCVINLDNFERGLYNFVLVIGLPGSGKGTFGRKLSEKYGAVHLEIDIFDQCGNMSDAEIKAKGEPFTDYILNTEEGQWYRKNAATLSVNEKLIGNHNFIEYCIAYCKSHKDKIFVIDGTPIYAAMEPEEIRNYPIIIKGTTANNSFMNKVNRDLNDKSSDKKLHSKVTPESLNGLLQYYWGDDRYLAKFKSDLENQPDVTKESVHHDNSRESDDDSEGVSNN